MMAAAPSIIMLFSRIVVTMPSPTTSTGTMAILGLMMPAMVPAPLMMMTVAHANLA